MLLDTFKLARFIVQIAYAPALELWDTAGRVNREIQHVWPGTDIVGEAISPNQVVLKGKNVQIDTGINKSTIQISHLATIDQSTTRQIVETFESWRTVLNLKSLTRVSSRSTYWKEFNNSSDANAYLFKLANREPRTMEKVFDQPTESPENSIDFTYKFEDEMSFAFLKIFMEIETLQLVSTPEIPEIPNTKRTAYRVVIDFDRGLKKATDPSKFRMDEWLKGFHHLLRRDVEKVLRSNT